LREANLCGASLFETNLRKANLRGADLTRADLREANLRGAKLILEGADLLWARLHGADLRKADLRKADLDVDAFDLTGFEPLPPYLRRFCFGIGKIPNESEKTRGAEWSGMAITERWAFERVDDEHFRATSGAPSLPDIILDVSRPSARTEIAWVHTGSNPAPLIGGGETRVWARQEDGSWIETDKVVSAWVT
jgi:hypothetical protein